MSDCERCERYETEIEDLRGEVSGFENRVSRLRDKVEDQCDYCNFEADADRFAEEATQAQRIVWEIHNADTICLCEVCSAYRHD